MPSLSPQPSPPDAAQAVAFSTTMTFRLLSRQSCILLGNRGLSDVFKIFGVRAAMQPVKDAQGLVEVTLSGSHHYASLAQQWIIARVAPHCALNFHLSTAELQVLFGAKQKNLTQFQLHSCCYIAENPPGSGNLLLQGSHQDVATAAQLISRDALSKRLGISLDVGESRHQSEAALLRPSTPFHVHGMQLRPTADEAVPAHVELPAAPGDSPVLPVLPTGIARSSDMKPLNSPSRLSLRSDFPFLSLVSRNNPRGTSPPPPPALTLKPNIQNKCPAPIIIDGESVALDTSSPPGVFSLYMTGPLPRSSSTIFDSFWFVRRGHDCVVVTLPARLQVHPNSQRPPVIDCDVLQSLNTSGALVLDSDPVARILALAHRCNSRGGRSAVVISKNKKFSASSKSQSEFRVLSFHISGSSFALLPKISANHADSIDSILFPSQSNARPSVFALSPIVVSSKRKPVTPLLAPSSAVHSSLVPSGSNLQERIVKQDPSSRHIYPCKPNTPMIPLATSVFPIHFGKDALDLVCDPSVWN